MELRGLWGGSQKVMWKKSDLGFECWEGVESEGKG